MREKPSAALGTYGWGGSCLGPRKSLSLPCHCGSICTASPCSLGADQSWSTPTPAKAQHPATIASRAHPGDLGRRGAAQRGGGPGTYPPPAAAVPSWVHFCKTPGTPCFPCPGWARSAVSQSATWEGGACREGHDAPNTGHRKLGPQPSAAVWNLLPSLLLRGQTCPSGRG